MHHAALVLLFNISGDQLDRLMLFAIDFLHHHARLGHSHFKAFAAHVFQQDGQVQLAPAHDFKNTLFVGLAHAQGDVVLQLFLQAVPNLATGHILAFAASQRAGVDAKVHGQGRLVDFEHWQRCGRDRVGDRHADTDVANTVDQHNLAGASLRGLHALQTLECQHLVDTAFDRLAVQAFHHDHVHHGFDGALADAANADAANEG